jgi:Xaa-Pro dipeptidase
VTIAKLHARSVAKHLGVKHGLIYLEGMQSLEYEDSDQPVHFRQRRYFYYLSGVNSPDYTITYHIQRDQLCIWIPPATTGRKVIYNGSTPTPEEIYDKYDFDLVERISRLDQYLAHFAYKEAGEIFILHPEQKPFLPQIMDGATVWSYMNHFDSVKLKPAMDAARTFKSDYELGMIRKANEITAQAHINVLRRIKYLKNEAEVEAIFTATCIAEKAKEQSYGVIAGSGENASTLHYVANNEPLKGRQLLCLDAGCEWKCYASDVTRTFPISGIYTPEAAQIYSIVERMQERCIKSVKPWANFRDIHMYAHQVATMGLVKLGILHNGTMEEIWASGASIAFFPHGVSHPCSNLMHY